MGAPIEFSGQTDLSSSATSGLDEYMQYTKADKISLGGIGNKSFVIGQDMSWLKWAAVAVALIAFIRLVRN